MSKKTQQEAKQPDAFVSFSDKLIKIVEDNLKSVLFAALALVVVGVVVVSYGIIQKKSDQKALAALYKAEKMLSDKTESLLKERQAVADKANKEIEAYNKKLKKKAKKRSLVKVVEEVKTPETLASAYGEVVTEFQKVIRETEGRKASYLASLTLSQLYSDFGELQKAMSTLESASKSLKSDHFFYGLIHNRMGSALAASSECDKANDHFSKVISAKEQLYLHADATLGKAICLEKLEKIADARDLYKRLADDFADTDSGRSAKTYLRLLSLKALNGGE